MPLSSRVVNWSTNPQTCRSPGARGSPDLPGTTDLGCRSRLQLRVPEAWQLPLLQIWDTREGTQGFLMERPEHTGIASNVPWVRPPLHLENPGRQAPLWDICY